MRKPQTKEYLTKYRKSKTGKAKRKAWLDVNKPSLKIINSGIFFFGW
jgi:hypothetical protein